jgi:divalent metal cation (Fe/Co/Zn/Cd) transporter
MSLRDAHALSLRLKTELQVKFPELSDVVIHVEPATPLGESTPKV